VFENMCECAEASRQSLIGGTAPHTPQPQHLAVCGTIPNNDEQAPWQRARVVAIDQESRIGTFYLGIEICKPLHPIDSANRGLEISD
jgi:hypothetical protein